MLGPHAQQLTDDDGGEGRREELDEVALAERDDLVEELVGHAPRPWARAAAIAVGRNAGCSTRRWRAWSGLSAEPSTPASW